MKAIPPLDPHPSIGTFLQYWFENEDNSSITRNNFFMMNAMLWSMDKINKGDKNAELDGK